MPQASDLIQYLAASRPEDDVAASGGAQSATARALDSQFAAAAQPAALSDNAADTMLLTVKGRLASGAIDTEAIALNGLTEIVFTKTFERILSVTLASAAVGTVTLRQGTGGTTRHTFAPGELVGAILFIGSESDPAVQKVRYEKVFWENTHATESLLTANVELTADPDTRFEIGLAAAKDDTGSVANRETAPGGITFVDDGVAQAVPGTDLAAGEAIGVWIKQTLAAAAAALKSTFTTQVSGSSA